VNVPPVASIPSNVLPSSLVTVWGALVVFCQVTVVPTVTVNVAGLKAKPLLPVITLTIIVLPLVPVGLGADVAVGAGAVVGVGLLVVPPPPVLLPQAASNKSIATANVQNQASILGFVVRIVGAITRVFFCIMFPFFTTIW